MSVTRLTLPAPRDASVGAAEPASSAADEPAASALLDVRGLEVVRGGRAVVRGIDLAACAGRVTALLGPSGAGKSTFFAAVAGELPVSRGSIALGGHALTGLPLWRRVRLGLGYLPQGPSVLFDLTVRENLATFGQLAGVGADAERAALELGLGARLGVRASELSGGERRRLELARALLLAPKVLLCDEPFAGVDPAGVAALASLLRAQADRGCAVIISDHHAVEALRVADAAHLLVDGRIEVSEAPARFLTHPAVTARYVAR